MTPNRYVRVLLAGLCVVLCSCATKKPADPWQAVAIPTDANFGGLWFTDSRNGWITGGGYRVEGGIVGRTRDGGRTWQFQSGVLTGGGTDFSLGGVQFRDSLRGCSVGYGGIVMVTDDGGVTWRSVRYGRSGGDGLARVQFLDSQNGWAVGPASVIRTKNGGESWGYLLTNNSENGYFTPHAIHMVDGWRGWLTGHTGNLMRTEDGGVTWKQVSLPLRAGEHPILWDVTFTDESHGWVVGEGGAIFHTVDAGMTWTRQEQGVPIVRVIPKGEAPRPHEVVPELETEPDRLMVSAVRFLDADHGWAIGYYSDVGESAILRTDDGGTTWRLEQRVPGEYLRSLFVLDRDHAWAVGDRSRTASQVVMRYSAR